MYCNCIAPKSLNYLPFLSFDCERTWWRLSQKRVARTNFNIYVFIGILVLVILFCYKHTITNWRKTTDTRIMLSLGNIALHGFLCLFLSCRWRTNYQTGLALPQCCACSKVGHGFPIFVVFSAFKYCWGEVILRLIDVGTIADHHCWKFKNNSPIVRFII